MAPQNCAGATVVGTSPAICIPFIRPVRAGLNLVERWFGELTRKAVRRGAFVSVKDLIQAIDAFLAAWNENPKPFVWTAKVEDIIRSLSVPARS